MPKFNPRKNFYLHGIWVCYSSIYKRFYFKTSQKRYCNRIFLFYFVYVKRTLNFLLFNKNGEKRLFHIFKDVNLVFDLIWQRDIYRQSQRCDKNKSQELCCWRITGKVSVDAGSNCPTVITIIDWTIRLITMFSSYIENGYICTNRFIKTWIPFAANFKCMHFQAMHLIQPTEYVYDEVEV